MPGMHWNGSSGSAAAERPRTRQHQEAHPGKAYMFLDRGSRGPASRLDEAVFSSFSLA